MLQREANEGVPINKPRAYEEDQRQRKKFFQKKCWFKKGGYDVPLFVAHTPGGELAKRMRIKEAQNEEKSILWAHSVLHHNSREDMFYMMRVTGAYNEPLDRQIMERVQISNFQGPVLMNRRNEMGGIRIDKMRYRRWGGD